MNFPPSPIFSIRLPWPLLAWFLFCLGLKFQSNFDLHLKVLEEAAVKMQLTFPGRKSSAFL